MDTLAYSIAFNFTKCRTVPLSGVYFVQVGTDGPIKIGRGVSVMDRVNGIQTHNPYPVRLLFVIPIHAYLAPRIEGFLHDKFRRLHIRGEWYDPDEELLDFIRMLRSDSAYIDIKFWEGNFRVLAA